MDIQFREDDPIGFGRRLLRLGTAWRRELDQQLRRYGLTDASWRPILLLGNLETPIRQGDLVRMLDMDGPSLARLLETLERDGLVERVEDPADRRSKLVSIGAPGRAIHTHVHALATALGKKLLAGIDTDELAICHTVFDRIEQTLRRIGQDDRTDDTLPRPDREQPA
ncbi:MAG: MarR family winged helix-turn-helix transcriptional regulator [Janthinobacterium lividum]